MNHRTPGQPTSFLGMNDLTTERSFDWQATWVIDENDKFCCKVVRVSTTRHWQMSGRLVQELDVCSVQTHNKNRTGYGFYKLVFLIILSFFHENLCNE